MQPEDVVVVENPGGNDLVMAIKMNRKGSQGMHKGVVVRLVSCAQPYRYPLMYPHRFDGP